MPEVGRTGVGGQLLARESNRLVNLTQAKAAAKRVCPLGFSAILASQLRIDYSGYLVPQSRFWRRPFRLCAIWRPGFPHLEFQICCESGSGLFASYPVKVNRATLAAEVGVDLLPSPELDDASIDFDDTGGPRRNPSPARTPVINPRAPRTPPRR